MAEETRRIDTGMKGANHRESTAAVLMILVGACLAVVAAGSLIAFSLLARRASETAAPRPGGVVPHDGQTPMPSVKVGRERPPEREGSRARRERDEVLEPINPIVVASRNPLRVAQEPDGIPRVEREDPDVERRVRLAARRCAGAPGNGNGWALGHCKHHGGDPATPFGTRVSRFAPAARRTTPGHERHEAKAADDHASTSRSRGQSFSHRPAPVASSHPNGNAYGHYKTKPPKGRAKH